MVKRGLPAGRNLMVVLEEVRSEGNKMFTERNWAAAVSKYSYCINLARDQLYINGLHGGLHDIALPEKYNHVVMLAYSNRAEARLRLLKYEDALHDADMALQLDPKHDKTLVRKGKALHGLGFFEKASEAFLGALAESPEERSISKLLRESSVALEQSRTGNYDLIDFFSRGCTGDTPSCADFVGPVEIRRASGCPGRWGLFATRSVELGELLLVSNPLAVVQHKTLNADGTAEYAKAEGLQLREKLVQKLVDRLGRSNIEMARFYSLTNKGDQEMELPSMELFKPGSEWTPPDTLKSKVNIDLICDKVTQIFEFEDVTRPDSEEDDDLHATGVMGLWVLPAFANHSCAPNCQHSFVGYTIFFRASGHITEGEELTIPYFADLFEDVEARRLMCKTVWQFTCNCERCLFEESLELQLEILKKLVRVHVAEADLLAASPDVMDLTRKQSLREELGKAVEEVEELVWSLGSSLSPKQQGWIRALFVDVYLNKSSLEDHKRDLPSSI